jgi:hypothetical protein
VTLALEQGELNWHRGVATDRPDLKINEIGRHVAVSFDAKTEPAFAEQHI